MNIWGRRLFFCLVLTIIGMIIPGTGAILPGWNATIPGISDLSISYDGSHVIAGTNTGQALVYDRNGTLVWETMTRGSVLTGCMGNGTAFLVASRGALEPNKGELRLFSGNGTQEWFYNSGWIAAMDLSGSRIAIGDRQGNVIVIDRNGAEISRFSDYPKMYVISDLSVSSDGAYVAYSNDERNPQVKYGTVSNRAKKAFSRSYTYTTTYADNEPIRQVEMSGNGAYIATAGGEGNHGLLVFYAKNGTRMWSKDLSRIRDLEITTDGAFVYTGTVDGDVRGYSRSGDLEWFYSTGGSIGALSSSTDGHLAAGNSNGDLYVFNKTGDLLWKTRVDCFPTGEISRVEISGDGSSLAATSNGRYLWYYPVIMEPGIVVPDTQNNSTLPNLTQSSALPGNRENVTVPEEQSTAPLVTGKNSSVPQLQGSELLNPRKNLTSSGIVGSNLPFSDIWNLSGFFRKFW